MAQKLKTLQGTALLTEMEARANKLWRGVLDRDTFKYELAQVYLQGANDALADELTRLNSPVPRGKK